MKLTDNEVLKQFIEDYNIDPCEISVNKELFLGSSLFIEYQIGDNYFYWNTRDDSFWITKGKTRLSKEWIASNDFSYIDSEDYFKWDYICE
jgi:hypothetical protein